MVSRAAYKLKEMNDQLRMIRPGHSVLDLGAAPGGWTQVCLFLLFFFYIWFLILRSFFYLFSFILINISLLFFPTLYLLGSNEHCSRKGYQWSCGECRHKWYFHSLSSPLFYHSILLRTHALYRYARDSRKHILEVGFYEG